MFLVFSLTVTLWLFWLILSGIYTPFLITVGAVSALCVALLARRMEIADREGHPVQFGFGALTYWPWLLKEIVKSALGVARIVIDPRLPISPTVVRFKPSQGSAVGLVTHANSITLTPGTITLDATHDCFVVHGLTREGAEGCIDSEMDARVRRFETGH
jgi:multicomponent Na+:H+ antiporter subunit E